MDPLLAPLAYLTHTRGRPKFPLDVSWPVVLWIVGIALTVSTGSLMRLTDTGLSRINDLLGVMAGFHMATLGVIASLGSTHLDEPLVGVASGVKDLATGKTVIRRVFLARLFGYLTFSCLAIFCLNVSFEVFVVEARWQLHALYAGVVGLWLSHVAVATVVGLYYLSGHDALRPE